MALADDIRILSGVELFEGFAAEQLRLLAFGAERQGFGAGEMLYREGERADSAFILVSGTVDLFRQEEDHEHFLSQVGPGALLGELALIVPTTRLSDARARTETAALRLDRKDFRRILEEYPELARGLRDRVARQLRELADNVEALAARFAD